MAICGTEEEDFREYLDGQSDPALAKLELANDRAWERRREFDQEVFDEMARHDAEGRS